MANRREIRFVSNNPHKIKEAQTILAGAGVSVVSTALKIDELQTTDIDALIRDKILRAFKQVGRPLFVEHTGLSLTHLNGFPGGLTQVFWDTLQADRFAELFGDLAPVKTASAKTHIAYCDGQRIYCFDGEIEGTVVAPPRGDRTFQWDCVFQPEGYRMTFAEMGDKKNEISMRKLALDKLRKHLEQK
jgi:XTP/dITP diphosphohydrolase